MSGLLDSLKDYFARGPFLSLSFMLTGRSLFCVYAPGRVLRAGRQALLALKPGAVEPSFEQPNIRDAAELGEKIREALRRTQPASREAGLLVPESSLKSFVFTFNEFPVSAEERRQLLLWRLKKQMPSLPEDVRLSFDLLGNGSPQRIFISIARPAIIKEYENAFAAAGLKVRSIGLPILGLFNLLDKDREKNVLLANVEEDAVSLLAVLEGAPSFYRFKPYLAGSGAAGHSLENSVIKEVAGTLTYLEEREKKKIKTLWLRGGLGAEAPALAEAFQKKLLLPVRTLEPPASFGSTSRERHYLAPLLGYWA